MARLRKPSPTEHAVFIPPPTPTTRTSPRKTVRESSSTRKLRYTSPEDSDEGSFLVPKAPINQSPVKKQRVLRPMESNASLARRPSTESLRSLAATPVKDKRPRRPLGEGGSAANHLYSKTLAKTVARRKGPLNFARSEVEETVVDEHDVEQSILCGDPDHANDEDKENVRQVEGENDDDADEEPVVAARRRREQPRARRRVVSDSEQEEDEEYDDAVMSQHTQAPVPEPAWKLSTDMPPPPLVSNRPPFRKGHSTISNWAQDVIDLSSSPAPSSSFALPPPARARTASFAASSRTSSRASNRADDVLVYSPTPTKQRSPRKAPPISRPSTPPQLPSPSKLASPSKKNARIPNAPNLRPSIDAFWDPEIVNDHNDKFSPSKPLLSPRKQNLFKLLENQMNSITISDDESDSFPSPAVSPRKKKAQSPTKKASADDSSPTVAVLRAQRKDFAARKHAIAESFIAEVDTAITNGRIAELSSNTGGIKLVWSKTLKTTAGRANWRREQIRLRTGPLPSDTRVEIRHYCSIELAEKVIDDEERLYNVLAHEYCHLATFMISEIRNNPHGAEFKSWGSKVTAAFKSRGVEVTTKHSYKIDYKYIWECVACGYEFKRHSKSIDPVRHSCGRCKAKLMQTKPTPRGGAVGKDGKKQNGEYQVFVKENFARVKKEMEGRGEDAAMGKVMEVVARAYREMKAAKAKEVESKVDDLEAAIEGLKI
ncbi:hypothetical protein P171DRAFT_464010 [Karstenula rhodostoma CBS 690.94]|uniref:SprT-like domain-containing protein n=1 Tax=Karstenula rhodostoma CBS 690.94 TaxID=1392251 RepID=A0A9P4PI19_9PLEO|nr:hypothetical protein P171DRAFT_464010 [Karstenula rhodostoma CBS 690.94]